MTLAPSTFVQPRRFFNALSGDRAEEYAKFVRTCTPMSELTCILFGVHHRRPFHCLLTCRSCLLAAGRARKEKVPRKEFVIVPRGGQCKAAYNDDV